MSDNPDRLANLATRETMLDTQLAAANAQHGLTREASEYRSIYADYAVIHREYVELAMEGDAEALKRAMFLQWYRVTEPSFLCGVSNLNPAAEHRLLLLVDSLCESNRLDAELSWMLPYYYLIADYYFQDEGQYPALVAHCQAQPHRGRLAQPAGFVSNGRGQMGEYWQSIFKASPVQGPDSDISSFGLDEDLTGV
jgi:hypothetical protein